MTEQRIPLDEMTSDQLDQLYARIDTLEAVCESNKRGYVDAVKAAQTAEAKAEAMTRAMESTAADALMHRGCHRELMGQCLRAERAEAEVTRLTAGQCTHAAVPDARTRYVASLTAAACDGDCGLTEQACQAAHPITRCLAGGVTHIDGPVTTIVDTILAVLDTETEEPKDAHERYRPNPPGSHQV